MKHSCWISFMHSRAGLWLVRGACSGCTAPGRARGACPLEGDVGLEPPGGGGIVAQLVEQAAAVLAHGVVDAQERCLLVKGVAVVARPCRKPEEAMGWN